MGERALVAVDIYGNPVGWSATGRRIVGTDGKLRAQLRRGALVMWAFARPHEDCSACAATAAHDACPVLGTDSATKVEGGR